MRKYRHGLKVMSGGFTLSGGEPLMQDRFAVKLFAAAKSMGIHTALDTNGYLGDRLSDDELNVIDLSCWISRFGRPERHRDLTGMDNETVLAFARRLASQPKKPVWFRYVLVPGWSDDPRGDRGSSEICGGTRRRRARGCLALSPDGPV